MQVKIRADSVEISGYVNAVERKSIPLWSRIGRFVERICKGAFSKALARNDDVRILLNHDPNRDLGGQRDGNLELYEASIGLHAKATITDREVIKKARAGELVGWSFGFYDREVRQGTDENGFPLRDVLDLDLEEVSILDNSTSPAYEGTLVAVRSEDRSVFFGEIFADDIQIREEQLEPEAKNEMSEQQENEPVEDIEEVDYSKFESIITEMKA